MILKALLICIVCLGALQVRAFNYREEDKQKHFYTSAGLSLASYTIYRRLDYTKWESGVMAFVTTAIIGIAKEMTDERNDNKDMEANLAGSGFGLMIPVFLNF